MANESNGLGGSTSLGQLAAKPSDVASTTAAESAEYLKPDEAAAIVRVSEKTLTRWAKADATFPILKIAGTTRYPRERLLRWFRTREQGQPSRNQMRPVDKGVSAKPSS